MRNVVTATFSGQTFVTTERLWKGDYGQVLAVQGLELPDYYEVHFASTKDGTPQVVVGTPEGIDIPNRLLMVAGYIYAWFFLHEGENDGETKYQVKIPVEEKGIPIDQETPEDKTAVQQAIEALNEETGKAEDAAEDAKQSKQAAETARDNAQNAANSAGEYAVVASNKAAEAAQSARTASDHANRAAQKAGEASTSADNAANSAQQAAESALSAQNSADNASEYATNAGSSAQAAADSASSAANSKADANTAAIASARSAEASAGSAQNAATSETNAAESARAAGISATAASGSSTAAATSASAAVDAETAAQAARDQAAGSATAAEEAEQRTAATAEAAIQQINATGAAQVQAVNTAGAAQVQAVEDKGEEVLASIPPDYSDLVSDVEAIETDANSLKSALSVVENALENDIPVSFYPAFTEYKYLKRYTGEELTTLNQLLAITGYIPVPAYCKTLKTNAFIAQGVSTPIVFYNASKTIVKSDIDTDISGTELTIPANCAFVRLCNYNDGNHANASCYIQFIVGSRLNDLEEDMAELEDSVNDTVGQMNDALSFVQSVVETGDNKKLYSDFTTKQYLKRFTGEVTSTPNERLAITGFIKVPAFCEKLITNAYIAQGVSTPIVFYSSNKSILKSDIDSDISGQTLSIPANTAYIRLCNYNDGSHANSGCYTEFIVNEYIAGLGSDVQNNKAEMDTNFDDIDNVNSASISFTDTGSYLQRDGTYIHNENTQLAVSDYILIPDYVMKITTNVNMATSINAGVVLYNSAKSVVSTYSLDNWSGGIIEEIPATAVYLRLCDYNAQSSHTGIILAFTRYKRVTDLEDDVKELQGKVIDWTGKKWTVIGDSITYGSPASSKTYHEYIADETGVTVNNISHGGTGYMRGVEGFRYQAEHAGTDSDLITIFGGVNDCVFDANYVIGDPTDTTSETICGCVNIALDNLEDLYPYVPLGVISPLPAKLDPEFEAVYPNQYPSIADCRVAVLTGKLKEICDLRGYPFLDLFHTSGLRPQDTDCNNMYFKRDSWDHGDGLHPNALGHKLIYKKILDFITGIMIP